MHDDRTMMAVMVVMHVLVVPVMAFHDDGFRVGESGEASDGEAKEEESFHRVG